MYARSKLIAKFVSGFDQLNNGAALGDILITSQRTDEYNGQAFNTKLRTFLNRVIHRQFKAGLSIVTRSDKNRLHCHVAVQAPCPLIGFDWLSFEQSERYFKLYQQFKQKEDLNFYAYYTRKYRKSMPRLWQKASSRITALAKHYGLGHARLVPIRKNMNAYKWYLVGNIPYKRDNRDKGLHYFTSWNLDTIKDFQVVNKYTRDFRRRLGKLATSLQLTSENYNIKLKACLGRHWFCRCEDLIKDIDDLDQHQQLKLNLLRQTIATYTLRTT